MHLEALVSFLAQYEVRYIVGGSTAMALLGVETEPNDLDIIPETTPQNLTRLADALKNLEAVNQGGPGQWIRDEKGEWKWLVEPETEKWRERRRNWRFDPTDPATFDGSFQTRLGLLDVVPEISGTFNDLIHRSVQKRVGKHEVNVMHVSDILATLTVARRKKDHERVAQLRQIQRDSLA